MAVLIEAISVVIRVEVLHQHYPGGWGAFAGAGGRPAPMANLHGSDSWFHRTSSHMSRARALCISRNGDAPCVRKEI
jgi:hypothetical protein